MFELLILCMLCGMDNFANKNVVHFVINQRRSVVERWTIQSNATSQAKPEWPFKRTVYRICAFMHRTVRIIWKNKTVFQANKRSMNDSSALQRTRYCSCCNFINEFGTSNRKSNLLVQRIHYLPLDRAARARLMSIHAEHTYYSDNRGNMYHETHYGFWFHVDWININFNDTCVFEAIKLALDVMPNERRNFFVFNYSIFFRYDGYSICI